MRRDFWRRRISTRLENRDRPLSGKLAPPVLNEPLAFQEVVNEAVTNRDISPERGLERWQLRPIEVAEMRRGFLFGLAAGLLVGIYSGLDELV